ncbi:GNAT family N-acetyltransferase [Bifidobacterium sp. 82T10]|uniref:GNAT family N-acetyltransferase n=1 Tax=Bifidobacterium miconis TaxID=2834435 RepID=A0ABS6WI37_9BIFI|nr:GNAT family N-acetyltransferase [Bifidobacterium miconis]MBW3093415.1 GNAT family N-acetyltransferase [Bifidobacterium miconis]
MVQYRDVKPSETNDLVDLINYAFGLQAQRSLAKAYAETGDVLPSRHKVAVDETTGRLLAAVGIYPQDITVGDRTIHAVFLGCVCVHPRHRGEGHMRKLIDLWHGELQRDGRTDIMVLWGLRHRYAHFGYSPCGWNQTYSVNESDVKHALAGADATGITFRPMFTRDGDAELVVRLNDSRLVHAERPLNVIERIGSYLGSESIAIDRNNNTIGYLVRAAGDHADVRELALADPADAGAVSKAYLAALKPCGKHAIAVKVAPYEAELNARFAAFAEDMTANTVCRANIFNYANVLEAWLPVAARLWRLEPGRLSLVLDGQPVTVTVRDGAAGVAASDTRNALDAHDAVDSRAQVGAQTVTVERAADPDAPQLNKTDAQDLIMGTAARYRRDLPVAPAGWFPLPMSWYWPDLN